MLSQLHSPVQPKVAIREIAVAISQCEQVLIDGKISTKIE